MWGRCLLRGGASVPPGKDGDLHFIGKHGTFAGCGDEGCSVIYCMILR